MKDESPDTIMATSADIIHDDQRAELYKAMAFEADRALKESEGDVRCLKSKLADAMRSLGHAKRLARKADDELAVWQRINTDCHLESTNWKMIERARAALTEALNSDGW